MSGSESEASITSRTFRRHALEDILPYWHRHAIDRECGGYFQNHDRQWCVTDPHHKNLVPTARLVYSFAQGALLDGPDWCAEAARHGLDFMREALWDEERGGWYWQVDRAGGPIDTDKHTYGHAFAILALSEYRRAFGDRIALNMAERTFDVLDEHVWDAAHGGYVEGHARNWSAAREMKTQNSQMHMVEALLDLHEVSGGQRYLDRAVELCRLMDARLFDHEHGCLPEFFHADWTDVEAPARNPVQPGHQMEWAWLLLRVNAHAPNPRFVELATQMVAFADRHGWDPEFGGYYTDLTRDGEVTHANKSFWPQCEGVMGPLWLWGLTGDDVHWAVFEKSARYCFEHFVDREYGGWFGGLSRENEVRWADKGSAWKADYHMVQMCAETYRFLSARGL